MAESGHGGDYGEGRVTAFVVITCIVAAMGGLLFGYDIGISGLFSSHPRKEDFFSVILSASLF